MKKALILPALIVFLFSCNDKKESKSFCDGNCNTNEMSFKGDSKFEQSVSLLLKDCVGDTLTWTHGKTINRRKIQLAEFMEKPIKMNKSAISCGFQDTSFLWFSFNDCATGRGYLLKLPYNNNGSILKFSGALNSFDSKFNIDPDMRAYTDRGNLYVVNVASGKDTQMTFKKEYEMDFNDIHKAIDTVSVSKSKMYIKLIDEKGNPKEFEKKIAL